MKNKVTLYLAALALSLFSVASVFAKDVAVNPTPAVAAVEQATPKIEGAVPAAKVAEVAPSVKVIVKADSPAEVTDSDFFQALMSAFGGVKGLSTLGVIALVVQLMLKFLSAPISGKAFPQFTGRTKINAVLTLTMIATLVGLMSQGMGWAAAATSGVGLAALSGWIQQMWVQNVSKKA